MEKRWLYHYRCLNHPDAFVSLYHFQGVPTDICNTYALYTFVKQTLLQLILLDIYIYTYICLISFQRKNSTLKWLEPRTTKGTKNTIADCRFKRRVYRKSTFSRMVILMGVEPVESWRDHLKLRHRKEGEEIHPSGNEHIPPTKATFEDGVPFRWVFLFVLLRVNSWITLIFS